MLIAKRPFLCKLYEKSLPKIVLSYFFSNYSFRNLYLVYSLSSSSYFSCVLLISNPAIFKLAAKSRKPFLTKSFSFYYSIWGVSSSYYIFISRYLFKSLNLPLYSTPPLSNTKISWQLIIVFTLCAIVTVVFSIAILFKVAWMCFSFLRSRAEVASSKRRIFGFLRRALAMARRCFCPPEIWFPAVPAKVYSLSFNP
jgi:hypothetical protein